MDSEVVIRLVLIVACLVAVYVLFTVWTVSGETYKPPATPKERWHARLSEVGDTVAVIVIVGLLIAAFYLLWDLVGLVRATLPQPDAGGMDISGLVIQLILLVACLVAVGISVVVLLALGMGYAGDGSGRPPATAYERWDTRLLVVGVILVAIVIVGLLIVALGILLDTLGLPTAVVLVVLCVLILRWA